MAKMQIIEMSEAGEKLRQLVNEVGEGGEPYFIVADGKVKAVVVGINRYNDMMEELDDWRRPTGTSVVP